MYPNLCVLDANVVIDLHTAGLLERLSELPFRLVIPDSVAGDELRSVSLTAEAGWEVESLGWEELERAMALYIETYPSLSIYDAHVLVLADSLGAFLLTGDRVLRNKAEKMGVEVHGILWLLDVMMASKVLDCMEVLEALDRMASGGSRLPVAEIGRLKAKWGCL